MDGSRRQPTPAFRRDRFNHEKWRMTITTSERPNIDFVIDDLASTFNTTEGEAIATTAGVQELA
jgi:hypothetical protein